MFTVRIHVTLPRPPQVCPGQTVGLHIGSEAKKVLNFYCTCLKMQSNVELNGLGVDSWVIEHIQVNKAPRMPHRTHRAHGQINPFVNHRDDLYWWLFRYAYP